jgi:hypothetical protein
MRNVNDPRQILQLTFSALSASVSKPESRSINAENRNKKSFLVSAFTFDYIGKAFFAASAVGETSGSSESGIRL